MASTVVRALIEGATWESIQAQPYDGTRYPCGCHPHPKEPHLRFHLCDYHDGFDSGVDQGCHELQTENERLQADLDAERALADQLTDAVHGLRLAAIIGIYRPSEELAAAHSALAAHAAARTNGSASATDVGGPS